MPLGRNTRRRIALYGTALVVAAALLAGRSWLLEPARKAPSRHWDAAAAKAHEATRLLRDLVRVDTAEPHGTRGAVEVLARDFACEGIPYEIVGEDPERPILVARLAGRTRAESLLLLNHLDVVDPGNLSEWTVPPFAGDFGKGQGANYLYGRGTLDMKGQAVAGFWAMAELKRRGIVPRRDVVFVGEPGEEAFRPEIGIGWLMEHRPDLLDGVTNVYNEGGVNETLTRDVQRFGIEVLQKATVNFWVRSRTKRALEALKEYCDQRNAAAPLRTSPPVLEYLQLIGPSRNDVWGRPMTQPEKVVSSEIFRSHAPDVYQNLVRDRLYCGAPEEKDGRWEMEVAWSLLPGSSVAERRAELEGWLRERGLTWRPHLVTSDCVAAPESGRGWEALVRAFSLDPVEKGAAVGAWVLPGAYTSSSYCRAHGLNAYGVSPFSVNIFDASKIHNPNERILVASFVEGVERMARIVREYATAP